MAADANASSDAKPGSAVEMVELKAAQEGNRLALAQAMGSEEFLAAEKALKRKLDMRLLASVWLIFVLNYLDRVSRLTNRS